MDRTITKEEIIGKLKEIVFLTDDSVKCSERLKAIELLCKITGIMNEEQHQSETIEEFLRRSGGD